MRVATSKRAWLGSHEISLLQDRRRLFMVGIVLFNFFVLVCAFSFPPILLKATRQYQPNTTYQEKIVDSKANDLILAEVNKAINEIQMRLEDQSRWFQYKFLFVGGLLAAFLGIFPYARLRSTNLGDVKEASSAALLERALKSKPTLVGLAAITCLSLMIDLHIRGNAIVISQIGLWIASHIEPLYLNNRDFPPYSFLPWESFLRQGGAMHTDVINSVSFFWPIHILTIVVFLLYIISERISSMESKTGAFGIETILFWFVHVCLMVLTWSGHYVPPIFQVKVPFFGLLEGVRAASPYLALVLLLTIVNWVVTIRLRKRS